MSQLLKEDPKKVAQLLIYAATFPDFPKDFAPPGLTDPNYVPPNKSQPLLIYAYFLIGLTTLTVILRLWIRSGVKGMIFGWDDYLIIPGQLFSVGLFVVLILLMRIGGVGMHVYDVTLAQLERTQTLQFAGIQIYMTAIFFIRLSITALLYRLMGYSSKIKRWLLHITVLILAVEWIVQILAFIFATKPISAAWDMNVRLSGFKKTVNLPLEVFILTIFYLVMDVWLLILPIHTIWTLQLPLRTRISVTGVFIFGGVACAGAIVKTVYIYPVLDSYDSTWNGCGFIAGALTEVGFGVVSSSMPALNHLIVKVLPQALETWVSSTRFRSWFSAGSSETRARNDSFKDSLQDSNLELGGIGKADSDKAVLKTMTLDISSFNDEPPSRHFRDPANPRNFSKKTPIGEMYVEKTHNDTIYSPSWLGGSFERRGDLKSNALEFMTPTETATATTVSNNSEEDINSRSWLNQG